MHLIAFAAHAEALDNYFDALSLVGKRDGSFELLYWHVPGTPLPPSIHSMPRLACRIIAAPAPSSDPAAMRAQLDAIAVQIVQADPDVFFLCDCGSAPSNLLPTMLHERGFRSMAIGGQGTLSQPRSKNLGAGRVLCFGNRQMERLHPEHRLSAYPAGLPRLDRLKGLSTSRAGYVVFLAHRSPEPPVVNAALVAFEKNFRLPVVVCESPAAPNRHSYRSSLPVPSILAETSDDSTLRHLQHCDMVLATDSTRVIDAMYLGKPVVLLPNSGLTAFDHYPGISDGFGPVAIHEAFQRLARQPQAVTEFLQEMVGGVRFDHSEHVFTTLARLVVSGPLRRVKQPATPPVEVAFTGEMLPKLSTRVELLSLVPKGGRSVELGVAKGSFSDELLRARADIHLSSVDRWAGDRGHGDEEFNDACALLEHHGDRCTVIRKSFENALADFAADSMDLIYIDGYAHNGQEGGQTLNAWWEKVKPGGVFAGHDYHPDWKPTVEAVDQFCRQHGLTMQLTSGDFFPSWYVRKPRASVFI